MDTSGRKNKPVGVDSAWIADRPIAHRGLHNAGLAPENTLAAAKAAISRRYAIEVDLQWAADAVPVVFHDGTLDRLTEESGRVRDRTSRELSQIRIMGSAETIPSLESLLETVQGQTGIVLELKGLAGEDEGYAQAVASILARYRGPICVMSFHHWLVRDLEKETPAFPLGLTGEGGDSLYDVHREIDHEIGFDFLSYKFADLDCRFVREFRASNRPVICWTVRSQTEAEISARFADQITFECFVP